MPVEVRAKLLEIESFRDHFSREIEMLSQEKEYRKRAETLLKQYFANFDDTELRIFLSSEVKEKGWDIFNHLFIRKAIDFALDKGPNEKEACSKLLQACTQEYSFHNREFGYAFDYLVWVSSLLSLTFRTTKSTRLMCLNSSALSLPSLPEPSTTEL